MFKRSTQKSGRTALSRSLHSLIALGLTSTMGISEAFANETNKQSAGTATAVRTDIQSKKMVKISGNVMSSDNQPLVGVTVIVEGTVLGTTTGLDGDYTLSVPAGSVVTFSLLGYETKKFSADAPAQLRFVTLYEAATNIDDVVVVGFGTQKKESLVSSITTISPKELKGPTSNLTTMLAGRIPGMISYQCSGEPGQDNAQFFIRGIGSFGTGKVDPLILIDGIESSSTDLARLQPDDIATFSILKDATAAAVYGARGANGVVLVNTKSGEEGATRFTFRAENSISSNTRNFRLADNITYMELANEAAFTRNPLSPLTYSLSKIENTRKGANPILYPNNNWIKQMIKDYTMNQRFNASLAGGGKVARYYISGTFNIDNGVLRNNDANNFNNNVKLKNYSIRSNTDINLTKSTVAKVRVYGQFDDYTGPIGGGSQIFNSALLANPVAFPAYYPSSYSPNTSHIMFGSALVPNSTNTLYVNPYAQMISGYQTYSSSTIMAQLELEQDFSFLTEGLSARVMGYTQRYSYFSSSRQYNPFYYQATATDDGVQLRCLNPGGDGSIGTTGTEYLNYTPGEKKLNTVFYGEAAINYNRTFAEKHAVGGMLIGTIRHSVTGDAATLEASLPSRNLGLSGRFSYAYDSRYFLEFNFGYNGSERFAQHNRWGFFPSVGAGWTISNEPFFESAKDIVRNLKIRASYGLVGNDQIGDVNDRFFYMSNVNLNDSNRGHSFGDNSPYTTKPGVSISRYANYKIGWEESRQLNVGLDVGLWDLTLMVDVYQQKRSNILLTRSYVPSTMGLQTNGSANVGKAETKGIDISLDYAKFFSNGFWTQVRGTFTFATSKITRYDEPAYAANEYYRSVVGQRIGQPYGYIAERLFIDDDEVANSPLQTFGEYEAGDIKYRDINGDGQITEADKVPIGHPTTPEINYGFGATMGYKGFDFSFYFQGSGRSSIFIDADACAPFIDRGNGLQSGLLKVIANDHWSEDNRNSYAFWPRLSDKTRANNNQTSTWWMRNGAFLRLKSIEIGYNLPDKVALKIGLKGLRVYANCSNLFSISQFKLWDPEMGGSGLGYPVQRTYNIGLNITL